MKNLKETRTFADNLNSILSGTVNITSQNVVSNVRVIRVKLVSAGAVINYDYNQRDATIQVNLLFLVSSTCFGRCFGPSSGAGDCIYSIW